MRVHEHAKIHIHQYPFAETLNPILHKIIMDGADKEDMGAIMTDYFSFEVPEFKKIGNYALDLIRGWEDSIDTPIRPHDPLILNNIWGQWYRKGDFQISHVHYPNQWSFVYYVNTPRGSSPLVFTNSKKKVAAKAGNMVIFPSWVRHQVPPNKCEGRSVVGGNFCYENKYKTTYRSNVNYDAL
tara:strand:+ start:28 stop:576 length:549 start_codon:yes stop_codon:yes gene_type:complete